MTKHTFVTTNTIAQDSKQHLDDFNFAKEFRTLRISSHRRAGHTTLINRLAFDVGDDIGRRYSTLVISPSHDRARHNYRPDQMYYTNDDDRNYVLAQLGQDYAEEYVNIIRRRQSNHTGKVLVASRFDHIGFHTRFFLEDQRKAILELTGAEVDKFDLMLIDGTSDIKPDTLNKIMINFCNDVELFVLLQ